MQSKYAYALSLLGLKPSSWKTTSWVNFRDTHKLPSDIINLNTDENGEVIDPLPASADEFNALVKSYADELTRPLNDAVCVLDADLFFEQPVDKQEKMFKSWLSTCEGMYFPTYILTLNQATKDFLKKNFRFRYADDGSAMVYRRVVDVAGTIWEECPDSKRPFSTLQGSLRLDLEKTIVATSPAKEVDVFYVSKETKKIEYMRNVPFYKMYAQHRQEFINGIKGSEGNVTLLIAKFDEFVTTLKRQHNDGPNKWEVQQGMMNLAEKLAEMDEAIDSYDFIYSPDFSPVDLTNDPDVDAFAYFDLHTLKPGPTPDFDGFMDAVVPACRDMFMAAVYATVFAMSLLNQYIWIHGEGGDGKSSFLNALMKFLGNRLCCSLGQTMNSEFGLENAVGKRMIILSDVKTGLSVKSQLIHNLTGHDPVSINRKNKPIITKELQPIVWVAANEAPDVNFDARNEARRCLYIKMQEPSEEVQKKFYFLNEDGTFATDPEGRKINNGFDLTGGLLKEMPAILYKCKQAFEKVCPAPYSVIRPTAGAISLAEDNCIDLSVDVWRTYIDETFDFSDKEARMLNTEIYEALEETKQMHSDRTKLDNFAKRDVRRLLTVVYKCGRKKIDGTRYMLGLKRKNQ